MFERLIGPDGFPVWFFVIVCGVSFCVGVGIRWWRLRRQERREAEQKNRIKEIKAEQKRIRRKMKKQKNVKHKPDSPKPDQKPEERE